MKTANRANLDTETEDEFYDRLARQEQEQREMLYLLQPDQEMFFRQVSGQGSHALLQHESERA